MAVLRGIKMINPNDSKSVMSFLTENFVNSITDMVFEYNTITFRTDLENFHGILQSLKTKSDFNHLSDVACVDYMDEDRFEAIYHLRSHPLNLRCNVKDSIPRDSPTIQSISDIWPGAQMHERENHELFGIVFEGNPDLSPLFLEGWEEIPPFRKDFDTREYVKKELEDD
jgi:NADH:ubiquinone oxidoreductase subunit C